MKRQLAPFIVIASLMLASSLEARPRPGGLGGGGGPGGGFRPGRPSQPIAHPGRPAPGPRPGPQPARPGNEGPVFGRPIGGGPGPIRPNPGPLPSRPGGRPNAGDIAGHIGDIPGGHFPGSPGHRPGYPYFHRRELLPNVQQQFRYIPGIGYPYGRGWYGRFGWPYVRWPYWAGFATGAAITSWLSYPPYGGYGSSTTIVYYPEQPAPAQVYDQGIEAVSQVANAGQTAPVDPNADWLNLGAFGLVPSGQKQLAYGLQLAVSRAGIVRGMMWDMASGNGVEVAGSIDRDTLRIGWQAKGDASAPYFETTVDQLSQEESLVNVYDQAHKSMVSWQMVEIDASDLPPQS